MTRAELRAEQADGVARLKDQPDEFHPDVRVAAAFADLKANDATQRWLEKELKRLEAKELTSRLLVEMQQIKHLLTQVRFERIELEEVAAQWRPSTD